MVKVGLVVRLVAQAGKESDLESLLAGALPLARAEQGTPIWLAVRTSDREFWIVDAHPTSADRAAHLEGEIAAALMQRADELLAEPPTITESTIVAAKGTTL